MYKGENLYAVITAAGSGKRMGNSTPKQFLTINGLSIIERTINKFHSLGIFDRIILVIRDADRKYFEENLLEKYKGLELVSGGETRSESTYNAIKTLDDKGICLFHDGVRPFISKEDIIKSLECFEDKKALVFAVREKDTVKVVENMKVVASPDREKLFRVQTPQIFRTSLIKEAYDKLYGKIEATDDSSYVSELGEDVHIYEASYSNIKITTPEDLLIGKIFALEEEKI